MALHVSVGKILDQGGSKMQCANTLAYYNMATFMVVKSFIVQAPGEL
jgi:hypothetical protein